MNYEFQYNSQAAGKVQSFGYKNPSTSEYLFSYGKDIYSDLERYNAPIFALRKDRSVILNHENKWAEQIPGPGNILRKKEIEIHHQEKNIRFPINTSAHLNIDKKIELLQQRFTEKLTNNYDTLSYLFGAAGPVKNTKVFDTIAVNHYSLQAMKQNELFLKDSINKINTYKEIILKQQNIKEMFLNNESFMSKEKASQFFSHSLFEIKTKKNVVLSNEQKMIYHPVHDMNIHKNCFINHDKRHDTSFIINGYNIKDKHKDGITLIDEAFVNNTQSSIIIAETFKAITKKRIGIELIKSLEIKHDITNQTNLYSSLVMKRIITKEGLIQKGITLNTDRNGIYVNSSSKFYRKYKKKLSKKKMDYSLQYDKVRIWTESSIILNQNSNEMRIFKTNKFYNKDKFSFSEYNHINLFKDNVNIHIKEDVFIEKGTKGFKFDIDQLELLKDSSFLVIEKDIKTMYKKNHDINIIEYNDVLDTIELPLVKMHDNTVGLLLAADNVIKHKESGSIYKRPYSGHMDDLRALSKASHYSKFEDLESFIYTNERKTFLEYFHPIMSQKISKKAILNSLEQILEKDSKNGIIYNIIATAQKNNKAGCNIYTQSFLNKTPVDASALKHQDVVIYKSIHKAMIEDEITITKKSYIINKKDRDEWISNTRRSMFFSDNISFFEKDNYEMFLAQDSIVIEKAKDGFDFNTESIYLRGPRKGFDIKENELNMSLNNYNMNYPEEYIMISKEQYELSPLVQEMKHLEKVVKDLEKPVTKTYNWAYVYHDEDPIAPSYEYHGLDELLLPEKDVDYSSFEDDIFNKKTLTPKSPVKIIDDNTFIAKYPIKHPTPNYEEVGIEYIDVPTDLMRELFLKFYQIWYANIFKFGNMSMVESLKLMLDYMYSYIVTSYTGSEYLKPALRIFRQIRWFGETSVMKNAQYKITFEYEDLKSNLQKGYCSITNVMSGMFVDTALKVISTDPTYFNKDAYITLYTQNRYDTSISFSISLIAGSVDIYLNEEYIDTIYHSSPSVIYNLPSTTQTNVFTIKRESNVNYSHCYIGNIVIKKGLYKNLNIGYDPELKSGNMPLNDVVNKMVMLANMYDDEEEIFKRFREGNLAVSELYNHLQEYWELHHANKTKGKRLTIKET